jgi:hypothetical protein
VGEGVGVEPQQQESLVLYKLFNTLCPTVSKRRDHLRETTRQYMKVSINKAHGSKIDNAITIWLTVTNYTFKTKVSERDTLGHILT